MPNGIEEMTNVTKPVNPPTEFSSKNLVTDKNVEQMSAKRIDEHYPEPVADVNPEPERKTGIDYDKPLKTEHGPEQPLDIGKIPGVKEVYIKPTMTKATEQKAVFMDPKTGKPLDFSMRQFLQETMQGGMINRLIKRYDLEGIDLEKEFERVQKKESHLSASKRKAVVALYNMRKQQQKLLADIGKELMHKDNLTEDDLRALLDSVEDASTNTQEVAQAVAENIVQKSVNQIMEEAQVDYTPEPRTEVNPETVHVLKTANDILDAFGRFQFRGVFSDYNEVKNPQAGDVCHAIVASKRPENIQYEDVFVYDGNKWIFTGQVETNIPPENNEKEPVKEEDGSIPLTIGE